MYNQAPEGDGLTPSQRAMLTEARQSAASLRVQLRGAEASLNAAAVQVGSSVLRPDDLEVIGGQLRVRHRRCIDCARWRPVVCFGYRRNNVASPLRRKRCHECFAVWEAEKDAERTT